MEKTIPPSKSNPLRIGIMCNNEVITDWQARCIEELKELDFVSIDLIIVRKVEKKENSPSARAVLMDKNFSTQVVYEISKGSGV